MLPPHLVGFRKFIEIQSQSADCFCNDQSRDRSSPALDICNGKRRNFITLHSDPISISIFGCTQHTTINILNIKNDERTLQRLCCALAKGGKDLHDASRNALSGLVIARRSTPGKAASVRNLGSKHLQLKVFSPAEVRQHLLLKKLHIDSAMKPLRQVELRQSIQLFRFLKGAQPVIGSPCKVVRSQGVHTLAQLIW